MTSPDTDTGPGREPNSQRGQESLESEAGLGQLRRVDHGAAPDRHPHSVVWPDGRRPQPRRVDNSSTPVADELRRRMYSEESDHRTSWAPESVESDRHVGGTHASLAPIRRRAAPAHRRTVSAERDDNAPQGSRGVEANARLTAMTATVLLILLAIEGFTILRITPLLNVHVAVGMVLIPVVLLKVVSVMWRFCRYYLGDPAYRRKGPPPPLLRLLGPFVVVLTLAVLASGVALLLAPVSMRSEVLVVHRASFIVWIAAMAVHVLGHLLDTARLAPRDFYWRTRRQVQGAGARQWLVVASIGLGLLLIPLVLGKVGLWLGAGVHK